MSTPWGNCSKVFLGRILPYEATIPKSAGRFSTIVKPACFKAFKIIIANSSVPKKTILNEFSLEVVIFMLEHAGEEAAGFELDLGAVLIERFNADFL